MDSSAAPVRIGVARDRAFCFYYEDNLDALRAAGADLVAFSPLDDRELPDALDALYVGGGYPELWAEALTANVNMKTAVRRFIESGRAVLSAVTAKQKPGEAGLLLSFRHYRRTLLAFRNVSRARSHAAAFGAPVCSCPWRPALEKLSFPEPRRLIALEFSSP